MNTLHTRYRVSLLLVGSAAAAFAIGACNQTSKAFDNRVDTFEQDAAAEASTCPFQCSLDGRAVLRSCTGEVVETCSTELACGGGRCQEPCAAAAADKSSLGCEFYLQPPYFTKSFDQNCYASYVVNTSTVPVELSLEYQGEGIDLSKSVYRTNPGDATLVLHEGPLQPGESAILFVSDGSPDKISHGGERAAHCPEGIVPATFADGLPDGTGIGSSFHLTTSAPVSLAAIYPYGGARSYIPSATLLLPVATWGTNHVIVNAWERIMIQAYASAGGPAAQIVASEDDTDVTILPTQAIDDGPGVQGAGAKVPVTYRLGKGQVLQINQGAELSGSMVSSNKPTSIFGGQECMFIPSRRVACDTALQQLPAIEQWGSEYVAAGYRPRLGNEYEVMPYRIVAARDGTVLDYDPVVPAGAPLTMSAGEVVTFWGEVGSPFVVRTQDVDHPIYLAAYMSGAGGPKVGETDPLGSVDLRGNGDPEFVNVVPAGQYLNSYSFFADPTYDETSLVIVRAKAGGQFKDVWLECAGTLADFKPVGGRGDYEWTRVDLARNGGPGQAFDAGVCKNGLQRMRSEGPFTATLWGWAQWASYAYPGGMAQRKLVANPIVPVH
ncbi:hypothetical protein AKJ09_01870 [Labilithrix luteola]|uniref:IgGFc-binding protein N-terminal domain-containing protein n=1 Tax=Labilithrix luteola TaxID=1391654 RepID=A0A0K1PP96_9BACT|nr:IgGFc-binding protein [Labilithrix luteola]AKU95206.1 hypothetical protein AKJ09_01870 [Labilithrix luteola]